MPSDNARYRRPLAGLLALMAVVAAACPAVAADTPAPAAPPEAQGAPVEPSKPEGKAEIHGFRSARFGMSEDEVRKSAIKDFGVKAEAIKSEENPLDKTRLLIVKVADVLPKGGAAHVNYIFGHKSKKLAQISVVWSKATDAAMAPQMLVNNANILSRYFQDSGFKADSILVNTPLKSGGIAVFRGQDAHGRMVFLTLSGTTAPGKDNSTSFAPESLQLSYIADPANPDIFRLQPGQF